MSISLIFFVFIFQMVSSDAHARKWKRIRTRYGVQIFSSQEPGREFPSFKGIALVNTDMYRILAILRDASRRKEWMSKSGMTRVLERRSTFEEISYQQTITPWPLSHRDVVMHTNIYLRKSPHELIATFDRVDWKSPIKGVNRGNYVEMSSLKGYWRLVPKGDQVTEVTYMVNADPGGSIPNFLVKRAAKHIPYATIMGLRKQIKRPKTDYPDFLNQYDPQRAGEQGVKGIPPEPPESVLRRLD